MIKSNASPSEESSPFYQRNKQICEFWESFILNQGGEVEGKYNAWSLILKGEFETRYKWKIKVKKSTLPNESLFIPAEKSIFRQIEFIAFEIDLGLTDFKIRKKPNWIDIFKRTTKITQKPIYVLEGKATTEVLKSVEKIVQIEGLEYISYSAKAKQLK